VERLAEVLAGPLDVKVTPFTGLGTILITRR